MNKPASIQLTPSPLARNHIQTTPANTANAHGEGTSDDRRNAVAYANFYVGIYQELRGNRELAEAHLRAAAQQPSGDYMGEIMKLHWSLFCEESARLAVPTFQVCAESAS